MKKITPTFTSQGNERVNLKITYYGSFYSADYSHERYGSLYQEHPSARIVHCIFKRQIIKESKYKQRFVGFIEKQYLCAMI